MSTSSDDPEPRQHYDASASAIEAVAKDLIDLVEKFEAGINEGHVPAAFAEDLAELRQAAERLIAR